MTEPFTPRLAGDRIVTAFPKATVGETVDQVERRIDREAHRYTTIDYVYVVTTEGVLMGVISIRELHAALAQKLRVEEVMRRELLVADPLLPQERLVYMAIRGGIKSVPVVDSGRRLLGIVPYDAILHVFNETASEDAFKMAGFTTAEDSHKLTGGGPREMVRRRLPWLLIGVAGGTVTASVVSQFESLLSVFLVLAAFTPVLTYLSDAVGTQSETLAVRSITVDPKLALRAYLPREFVVAVALAAACGLALALVAAVGWQSVLLGVIVGTAMFLSAITAVCISTLLPFLFARTGLDPASAAGPLATMIGDISSIMMYFWVASVFLSWAGIA